MLNFPNIIVLLSISPFMSVTICFMHLSAPMLAAYIFMPFISGVFFLAFQMLQISEFPAVFVLF